MKKTIATLALTVIGFVSQAQTVEIKSNAFGMIFGAYNVTAEFQLEDNPSITVLGSAWYNTEEFKDWILRKLGAPVIQINVADEQVDDRIDEAIDFWRDYHYNGSQLVYLKHQITQDDIDNGYVTLPSQLLGISGIFNLNTSISTGSGIFNVQYQFVLNNLEDITGYNITNYYMAMQHMEFLQEMLVGKPMIRYNKHVNKLFIDGSTAMTVGNYIIIEAYDVIDSDTYSDVWTDRWLQNYSSALVREQWGLNLTKFSGMQLVGGVAFNGEQILAEAREDRMRMEEEAVTSLQPLNYNYIG